MHEVFRMLKTFRIFSKTLSEMITEKALNYYIIALYFNSYFLYHEISIIRQKYNKNRKKCDNIVEMLSMFIKSSLGMKLLFINEMTA